jgi:hypothetical protein
MFPIGPSGVDFAATIDHGKPGNTFYAGMRAEAVPTGNSPATRHVARTAKPRQEYRDAENPRCDR